MIVTVELVLADAARIFNIATIVTIEEQHAGSNAVHGLCRPLQSQISVYIG